MFTSDRRGSADIFRVHVDGSGLERLTSDPAFPEGNVARTKETSVDLTESKDNVIFGVRSVDAQGHRSLIVIPEPER